MTLIKITIDTEQLDRIEQRVEEIQMTVNNEDQEIQAVDADLTSVAGALETNTAQLATLITTLQGEIAAGQVSASTVTALQAVQGRLDAASSALNDVANPPAPTT